MCLAPKISILCASKNGFVSTFYYKNAKSNEVSNTMLIFRQKKSIEHLFFLSRCLVQNIHNKIMDNVLDTRA